MGYYIQTPKNLGKASQLVKIYQATIIPKPATFEEVPQDKALICVVDNRTFEAAGYCFSKREFQEFSSPDGRPRQWLLMDKTLAEKLSGFNN